MSSIEDPPVSDPRPKIPAPGTSEDFPANPEGDDGEGTHGIRVPRPAGPMKHGRVQPDGDTTRVNDPDGTPIENPSG